MIVYTFRFQGSETLRLVFRKQTCFSLFSFRRRSRSIDNNISEQRR